jgi:hypothetical protein
MGGPDHGLVRINSLGLRGPDTSLAKPTGTLRVLVLGDSFVFGVGVDEEHLLTSRLQALFDARRQAKYEVLNLGISGYSTDQEYLLFQGLGARLHPDIVVLVACDNDFEGNTLDFAYQQYYKPYFTLGPDGTLELRNSPVPQLDSAQQARLWLGQHANVWNAVRTRRSDSRAGRALLDLFQVAVPRSSGVGQIEITRALVAALHELASRVGADFVMFNTGHPREMTPLFQELRPRLRREGIAFLGLEEHLETARAAHPDAHWDFGLDPHWNVDAHQLAADVVYNFVETIGLLDRREARVGSTSGSPSRPGISSARHRSSPALRGIRRSPSAT